MSSVCTNTLSTLGRWWHSWGRFTVLFLAAVIFLRATAFDLNRVPSGSMQPTLLVGDRVAVNRLAYGLHVPFTSYLSNT